MTASLFSAEPVPEPELTRPAPMPATRTWTPTPTAYGFNQQLPAVRGNATSLDIHVATPTAVDPAKDDLKIQLLRNVQASIAGDKAVLTMRRLRAQLADAMARQTAAEAEIAKLRAGRDQLLQDLPDDLGDALVRQDASLRTAEAAVASGQEAVTALKRSLEQATEAAREAIQRAAGQAVVAMRGAIALRMDELCIRLDAEVLDGLSRLAQRRELLDSELGQGSVSALVLQGI